jgi:predicted glycosyltransferase
MRLLVYSQDGMGLGHLRRTRNIAREVLSQRPDCRVLAIADAPDAPFFRPLPGVDFLKLPTIVKTGPAQWRAASPAVQRVVDTRSRLMLDAYEDFDPDVILVDHMPAGARGELKPLLECASARSPRPALVLGLRDVLDAPEAVEESWRSVGAQDYLPIYDTALVHGCREVFDADAEYGLSAQVRQLRFNHYVAPRAVPAAAAASDEAFVLVTGGGGADAYPVAAAFIAALPAVLRSSPVRSIVLTGPNMPEPQRQVLQSAARGLPVEVLASAADATALIQRATALVTMGGYNTLCEVLSLRKPAVVVPRPGPSAEQRIRARLFSDRGLIRVIDPDVLTPEGLAAELASLINGHAVLPDPANIPPLDGAQRAATLLVRSAVEGAVATGAR